MADIVIGSNFRYTQGKALPGIGIDTVALVGRMDDREYAVDGGDFRLD